MNLKKHMQVYQGLPKNVYILFLSTVINKIGGFIAPLMTMILTVKIGLPDSQVGIVATIAMLSQAPFIMLGGNLVDRYGAKKMIIILHTLGAALYLICAAVKPSLRLAVLIIIASDLYAMASPAPNALIPIVTTKDKTKNAYSLMYLGLNLGLAIGPLIGGLLFNTYLSLLFVVDAITTLISAGIMLLLFDERHQSTQAVREDAPETSVDALPSMVQFLQSNPMLIFVSMALLLFNFSYIQWNYILPLQSVSLFHDSGPRNFSLLLSMNAITVVVLSPILTSVTEKIAALKSMVLGGIFYIISFLMFAVSLNMVLFMGSIIVMTIGEVLIAINMNHYIAASTPQKLLGRANSLISIVSGVGYAIGPAVMGLILTVVTYKSAWFIVSGITTGATVMMYGLSKIEKRPRTQQ
jgi:MFS family permease